MADGSQLPGMQDAEAFFFEDFGSLNTKANRPAIQDNEFSYNRNWFPLGPGNLRAMAGEGATTFTSGKTVLYTYPFNFGAVTYLAVFFTDGTATQQQIGGAATTISSTANLFYNGGSLPQAVQWQGKYLLIITNAGTAPNGYFIWDGTSLFQAGTVAPDVALLNVGSGYTSAPTITPLGGTGTGATWAATVANGSVTSVRCTNPGTGYLASDINRVQLLFSGGGSDSFASTVPTFSAASQGVIAVDIINGGMGFTTSSVVTFSGGGGSGAQAVVTGLNNGVLTQITVTQPGSGYTSAPSVSVNVGSGASFAVDMRAGQITGFTATIGGSGYNSPPEVILSAPDSTALPGIQATAIAQITAGAVSGFTITNPGLGYTKLPTATLVGGNRCASAQANLMPFGVIGTTIETFQNSVWVANGNTVTFTGPASTSNFATSIGGGTFVDTDSFLRYTVTALKQANGFLYLLNDSSVNVISNIQTVITGTLPTTTFNNSNVDPQIGCAWRDTVQTFNRAIVFANPSGVYALYGGAAEKVSQALDGLFVNANFVTTVPTAAVCIIFGVPCYVLCFNILDPFDQVQENMMAIWDGQKWFLASQIKVPKQVATLEINSQITAYGNDGTNVYPLFQTPSGSLLKVFQTKLRTDPTPLYTKQVNAFYASAIASAGVSTLLVSVDTEKGLGPQGSITISGSVVFVGAGQISFTGTGPVTFTASGFATIGTSANVLWGGARYGRFLGITGQSSSPSVTLVHVGMLFNAKYAPYSP